MAACCRQPRAPVPRGGRLPPFGVFAHGEGSYPPRSCGRARGAASDAVRRSRVGRSGRSPLDQGSRAARGSIDGMCSSSCAASACSVWCASFTAAAATSSASNSLASASVTTRKLSRSPSSSAARSAPRVMSSRRARTSIGVGTVATSIFCLVRRSMLRSRRCSRGSASVIATPSRPARPVRPMRCT